MNLPSLAKERVENSRQRSSYPRATRGSLAGQMPRRWLLAALCGQTDNTCKLSASCQGMRGLNFQDLRVEHLREIGARVRTVGSARWHDCGAMTCRLLTFL